MNFASLWCFVWDIYIQHGGNVIICSCSTPCSNWSIQHGQILLNLYTYFTNLVSQGEFRAFQVSCYLQQCWTQSGSSGLRLGHSPPTVCSSLLLYFLSLDPKEEILHHGNGRHKTAKPIHTWLSCMQWKIHVVTLMYEPLKISPPFSSSSLAVKQEKM